MDKRPPGDERVRVSFQLNPDDQQGSETESVWAERVGPDEDRILNSPFLVPGLQTC